MPEQTARCTTACARRSSTSTACPAHASPSAASRSELGASRTPLRAALMRLEADGLVERDGRAWQVSPIDLGEIARLSELRDAAGDRRRAAQLRTRRRRRRSPPSPTGSAGSTSQRPDDEPSRAGTDFHVELAALSGNHFFADAVDSAMTRLARTRWLEVRTRGRATHGVGGAPRDRRPRRRAGCGRRGGRASTDHIVGTHERLLAALDADARTLRARGLAIVR